MHGPPTPLTIEAFLASVERKAYRMALLATRDASESFDIVQESMLKLVQYYRNRKPSEWGPLFQKILQHDIVGWYRDQSRQQRWLQRLPLEAGEADDPVDNAAAPEHQIPERVWERADNVRAVLDAVGSLALRQQQAFLLRQWEGYDVATTADIMGCTEGSVKTHYFRALQQLRKSLRASLNEEKEADDSNA